MKNAQGQIQQAAHNQVNCPTGEQKMTANGVPHCCKGIFDIRTENGKTVIPDNCHEVGHDHSSQAASTTAAKSGSSRVVSSVSALAAGLVTLYLFN